MKEKKQVILSGKEIQDCVDFQKKCMESLAEFSHKYSDEKSFEIFSIAFGIIVSNVMRSYGIKNINLYLNDMINLINDIHGRTEQNTCYMEYRKGVKVSEGRFN